MKEDWEYSKLGDVCTIMMGQSPSSDTYNDSVGLPFFQGNADFGKVHPTVRVYCNSPIRIADCGDILISVRAPIGAINIADRECCIGRGLSAIKNGKNVSNPFIYYALTANKEKLIAQGTGSTFKSIGRQALNDLMLPIPSLSEQEGVVAELDCLSGVIEKQKQQLKELDNLAESIFHATFGDPTTNNLGWNIKKLGEVCTVNPSKKDTSRHLVCSDIISFLPMEDLPIKACYYSPSQQRLLSEVQSSYTCFAENDILLAKVTPCFENGKVGIATELQNGVGYGSSEFIVLRPNLSDVIKEYIYYVVQDPTFKERACAQFTGTSGLRRVPRTFVENCAVSMPPLSLQQEFASKIEAIEKQKNMIKQSIAETETLFNSRMDYYFN